MRWLSLCPHLDLSKDHLHSEKNYLCLILHSFNFISKHMPINRISICLSQIVLDNFSLTLTSFVPLCLTTWLKECVRGIHKPENVESCSVCFKFTAWVTVNTHAPWVPHITKVGKMCIRCYVFSTQTLRFRLAHALKQMLHVFLLNSQVPIKPFHILQDYLKR